MVLVLALTLQITEPSRTRVSLSEEQDNPCSAASRGYYKDQVSKDTRKSQLTVFAVGMHSIVTNFHIGTMRLVTVPTSSSCYEN